MGPYLQSLVATVDPYLMQILVNVGIAIVLALGLNVIVGLTGQAESAVVQKTSGSPRLDEAARDAMQVLFGAVHERHGDGDTLADDGRKIPGRFQPLDAEHLETAASVFEGIGEVPNFDAGGVFQALQQIHEADHIIVGDGLNAYSFAEHGLI